MKKYILILCCVLPFICMADEDCNQALNEAKIAYNAANYTKAKNLFDYVVSECGANYGSALAWSQECQKALSPQLSVSRNSISVGSSSGYTSITVTSNRNWELRNTSSNMFSVSRSGSTINISYYSNSNTSSRSDYFDVITTDGSKSQRVTITQSAGASAPTLSVSKTSISCSSSATTEYITVSSNRTWEVQYASGSMYSVTRNGNSLTINIYANTSTSPRTDYFNIKTTDGSKVQKITLNQAGKTTYYSTPNPYATINSAWIDYDVYNNGVKGMKIHVKFVAYNVKGHKVGICLHFHYTGGDPLKDFNNSYGDSGGKVAHSESAVAPYDDNSWDDFTLFFPYNELHMMSGCKNTSLSVDVGVYDWTKSAWLTSSSAKVLDFTYSN